MPKEAGSAVRDNFDKASFGCGIRVRLADAAFLYNPPKFKKACKAVRDWAMFFASKAMSYKDEHGEEAAAEKFPFIIELWKEMQDWELVRDQLLHVLVAGRDSTASLLCWTLWVWFHSFSLSTYFSVFILFATGTFSNGCRKKSPSLRRKEMSHMSSYRNSRFFDAVSMRVCAVTFTRCLARVDECSLATVPNIADESPLYEQSYRIAPRRRPRWHFPRPHA